MFINVWDDINEEVDTFPVTDIPYNPSSLSNILYRIISNPKEQKKLLKANKITGLFRDIGKIQNHHDNIDSDPNIAKLIKDLIKEEEIDNLSRLDKVFLNCYYRKVLRAKLEERYLPCDLVPGLVIDINNSPEIDKAVIGSLRVLRVVCNFLGIKSTISDESFPIEKLYCPIFWSTVSVKFVEFFGENRITMVDDQVLNEHLPNAESIILKEEIKELYQTRVLELLNRIFDAWSGSVLIKEKSIIRVIPAEYIVRILPKVK